MWNILLQRRHLRQQDRVERRTIAAYTTAPVFSSHGCVTDSTTVATTQTRMNLLVALVCEIVTAYSHPSSHTRGRCGWLCWCRAYIFPIVINFWLTFLRTCDKCKIINVQRNNNAFLGINATGCLFNTLKYYVCLNRCHGLWRTTALAIKTCLKTCLPRVNLWQITLLRGYIHPNEQPIVFMP